MGWGRSLWDGVGPYGTLTVPMGWGAHYGMEALIMGWGQSLWGRGGLYGAGGVPVGL